MPGAEANIISISRWQGRGERSPRLTSRQPTRLIEWGRGGRGVPRCRCSGRRAGAARMAAEESVAGAARWGAEADAGTGVTEGRREPGGGSVASSAGAETLRRFLPPCAPAAWAPAPAPRGRSRGEGAALCGGWGRAPGGPARAEVPRRTGGADQGGGRPIGTRRGAGRALTPAWAGVWHAAVGTAGMARAAARTAREVARTAREAAGTPPLPALSIFMLSAPTMREVQRESTPRGTRRIRVRRRRWGG